MPAEYEVVCEFTIDVIAYHLLLFVQLNRTSYPVMDNDIVVQLEELDPQELFDNTIINAIKFTPEGGRITIEAVPSESFVTVSVKDTGIGMTPDELSHLFEEFYKADPSRHELDSSALGLSICKRIVERAGGKIWAESWGTGKGTTLFLALRLARSDTN